jgi:cytochrome c
VRDKARLIGVGAFGLLLATLSHPAFSVAQSGGSGKLLFEKRCGGCHALDRDKEGPRLGGIYNRAAATSGPFPYSEGLRNSKIIWTDALLDRWLADPEKLVPASDMGFRVEKAAERKEIIAYLKRTSSTR